MNRSNISPLQITFYTSQTSLTDVAGHMLRLTRFKSDVSDGDDFGALGTQELGATLAVAPLSKLAVEAWMIPGHTVYSKIITSNDPEVQILKTTAGPYVHIRFICSETGVVQLKRGKPSRDANELRVLTFNVYKKIFQLIKQKALPLNIVRTWNFVPDILIHDQLIHNNLNSERYRNFNSGRQTAWQQFSELEIDNNRYRAPAATAIGSASGPLIIEALLTNEPVIDIENPRQKKTSNYSVKYGKNPPLFSRATVHLLDEQNGILFIAGTASVVGEDSVHENNPTAQAHETFANLRALIDIFNLRKFLPFNPKPVKWSDFNGLRVHIKYAEHLASIRGVVESYVGNKVGVCYVHDDICRTGLLLEIEANGILLTKQ